MPVVGQQAQPRAQQGRSSTHDAPNYSNPGSKWLVRAMNCGWSGHGALGGAPGSRRRRARAFLPPPMSSPAPAPPQSRACRCRVLPPASWCLLQTRHRRKPPRRRNTNTNGGPPQCAMWGCRARFVSTAGWANRRVGAPPAPVLAAPAVKQRVRRCLLLGGAAAAGSGQCRGRQRCRRRFEVAVSKKTLARRNFYCWGKCVCEYYSQMTSSRMTWALVLRRCRSGGQCPGADIHSALSFATAAVAAGPSLSCAVSIGYRQNCGHAIG